MINEAIAKLVEKIDLKETEAEAVMEEIMTGRCTDAQIAGFLTALRMKGETVAEITACARVMRAKAVRIEAHGEINLDREDINFDHETIVDTCGTGGSNTKTFNISTATAFVVAGAGVKVAKHGNRAVSSTCGSADVLEELGINLKITPEKIGDCLRQIGIGFLFAPLLHGAMKHVIAARKQLGIRTVFNILGPLTNPAG
ncbi:MAG TPA: anthranilate phosphoribosyltransferase, partial [Candidatus Marinimicrobia bacterium]|nr:anthranilate phosphoribosyltransferase [Candidatus Neomarinimicrobiota bacterium]